MLVIVRLITVIWAALGIVLLVKPDTFGQIISFCRQGKRLNVIGIVRIAIGVIFLLAASASRVPGLIALIGILILVKGILVFALSRRKLNSIIDYWQNKPAPFVRFLGLVVLALAWLVIVSV